MKTIYTTIILAITVVSVTGCAVFKGDPAPPKTEYEELTDSISTAVLDADRQAALIAVVSQIKRDADEIKGEIDTHRTKLLSLTQSYDSSRKDMEEVLAKINNLRQSFRKKVLANHAKIKSIATPDEWKTIVVKEAVLLSSFWKLTQKSEN